MDNTKPAAPIGSINDFVNLLQYAGPDLPSGDKDERFDAAAKLMPDGWLVQVRWRFAARASEDATDLALAARHCRYPHGVWVQAQTRLDNVPAIIANIRMAPRRQNLEGNDVLLSAIIIARQPVGNTGISVPGVVKLVAEGAAHIVDADIWLMRAMAVIYAANFNRDLGMMSRAVAHFASFPGLLNPSAPKAYPEEIMKDAAKGNAENDADAFDPGRLNGVLMLQLLSDDEVIAECKADPSRLDQVPLLLRSKNINHVDMDRFPVAERARCVFESETGSFATWTRLPNPSGNLTGMSLNVKFMFDEAEAAQIVNSSVLVVADRHRRINAFIDAFNGFDKDGAHGA